MEKVHTLKIWGSFFYRKPMQQNKQDLLVIGAFWYLKLFRFGAIWARNAYRTFSLWDSGSWNQLRQKCSQNTLRGYFSWVSAVLQGDAGPSEMQALWFQMEGRTDTGMQQKCEAKLLGFVILYYWRYFWTLLTHEGTCTRVGTPSIPGKSTSEHRLSNDPEVSSTARRSTYIGTSGMKPMMLDKKTDTRVGGQKNDGEIEGQ